MSDADLQVAWTRGWVSASQVDLTRPRGTALRGGGTDLRRTRGQSLDFGDHRPYVPGDDLRHINWRAYAATGQLVLKTFEEEVSPMVDVVCDTSASMFFTKDKARRVAELTAWILSSSLRQGLVTRFFTLGKNSVQQVSEFGEDQLPSEFQEHALKDLPLDQVPWRPRTFRILVSDLLFEGEPTEQLSPLFRNAPGGLVFIPYDEIEEKPLWNGQLNLEDVDSGSRLKTAFPPALQKKYRKAYQAHFETCRQTLRRRSFAPFRVPSQGSWAKVLLRLGEGEALE